MIESEDKLICPYCNKEQKFHDLDYDSRILGSETCEHCKKEFYYSVVVTREYASYKENEV